MAKSAKKKKKNVVPFKANKKAKKNDDKKKPDTVLLKAVVSEAEKVDSKDKKVGGARGIESMFRNAYRAQLDMIALAATKANIMISLNGILLSIVLVSGAYFVSAEPLILVPVACLLLTCTFAITFAVLAALPDVDKRPLGMSEFLEGDAETLIFEQFSKLSADEFDTAMWNMLKDHEQIYHQMISHIYHMGRMANKKFNRLHISYSAFVIGLIISVASLLSVFGYQAFLGA